MSLDTSSDRSDHPRSSLGAPGSGTPNSVTAIVALVGLASSHDLLGERGRSPYKGSSYFLKGIHFCLLLELATTVSMKSMPRTPASTLGKSKASSLGFSPAMWHFTVSAKFM